MELGLDPAQHAQRHPQLEWCPGLAHAEMQPPEFAPQLGREPGEDSFEEAHRMQVLCEVVKLRSTLRSRIVDWGWIGHWTQVGLAWAHHDIIVTLSRGLARRERGTDRGPLWPKKSRNYTKRV